MGSRTTTDSFMHLCICTAVYKKTLELNALKMVTRPWSARRQMTTVNWLVSAGVPVTGVSRGARAIVRIAAVGRCLLLSLKDQRWPSYTSI